MFRLTLVALLCFGGLAVDFVKCSKQHDDSNQFIKPVVVPRHLIHTTFTEDVSPKATIKFTAGARDKPLFRYTSPRRESETAFDVKQNEVFELQAPITYVEVNVEQVIT